MIASKDDLRIYIGEDLRMQGLPPKWKARYRLQNRVLYYMWLLRRSEYWTNCRRDPIARLVAATLRFRVLRLGEVLGVSVPRNTAGPGFSLAHAGLTRLNWSCKVGARARIHQGCCIAHGTSSSTGESGAATVGDDLFLGPNAVVVGPVTLGDSVFVLPGAVVTIDLPSGAVAGGVPAKILRIEENPKPWRPGNYDSLPKL